MFKRSTPCRGRSGLRRSSVIALVVVPVVLVAAAMSFAAAPGLGTADSYAVLAGTTITNTGSTTITGDVGLHPGSSVTGFGTVTLNGAQHVADAAALQAKNDLVTAYNAAAPPLPVSSTIATELGGSTLTAGVYDSTAGTFEITGTLTLDAEGDPDAVFIFQMASTLLATSGSTVDIINAGQACNVFWQVGSSATLDTSSTFRGNILALTDIHLRTGATVEGRVLARNGEVTLDTNTITRANCAPPPSTTTTTFGAPSAGGGSTSGFQYSPLLLIGGALLVAGGAAFAVRRRLDRAGARR